MSQVPHIFSQPAQTHEWGIPRLLPREMVPLSLPRRLSPEDITPQHSVPPWVGHTALEAGVFLLRDEETRAGGVGWSQAPSGWVTEDAMLAYLAGQVQVQELSTC